MVSQSYLIPTGTGYFCYGIEQAETVLMIFGVFRSRTSSTQTEFLIESVLSHVARINFPIDRFSNC